MSNRLAPRIYSDLIGKPYRDGGRGPDAYDCLGLAIELQRRQGREVPDFASTDEELERHYVPAAGVLGPALEIPHPEPGCAVLLRVLQAELRGEIHIGTMIDAWTMVHTMRGVRVCTESLLRPVWQRRVIGYFRPEPAA